MQLKDIVIDEGFLLSTLYSDILPFREGSKIDSNNLDILFEQLGFKVTVRRNLDYQDMMRTINAFSDLEDHQESQMCVVIILSHGDAGGLIYAADGREVCLVLFVAVWWSQICSSNRYLPSMF